MSLLCLGLSHQNAPLELRERLAVPDSELNQGLNQLRQQAGVEEAVILSTCNRTELYLAGEEGKLQGAGEGFLRQLAEMPTAQLPLFAHQDEQAAVHLCRVAGGLESMVLGETEILGQVKQSYQRAQKQRVTGENLNHLFQQAFRVAKKIRSNSEIQRGSSSVASVAVELAERIFGKLDDCYTMILGAGETSRQMAQALASRGVKSLIVSNRRFERAQELAAEIGGEALHFQDWEEQLANTDILLAATAAPHQLISKEKMASLIARRRRPLFAIDIALPRDLDPAINELQKVYLYDLDAIEQVAAKNRAQREQQLAACMKIIDAELAKRPAILYQCASCLRRIYSAGGLKSGEFQ